MSDICKEWYEEWKKRYRQNIELWNTDKEKCCKKITGIPLDHAAWRYMHIDGAIDRMGGFANFRHYVNYCAEEDYLAHAKLEEENERVRKGLQAMLDSDQFPQKGYYVDIFIEHVKWLLENEEGKILRERKKVKKLLEEG